MTEIQTKRRRGYSPPTPYEIVEDPYPTTAYGDSLPARKTTIRMGHFPKALEALAREIRKGGIQPALQFPSRDCIESIRRAAKKLKFKVQFFEDAEGRLFVRIVDCPE